MCIDANLWRSKIWRLSLLHSPLPLQDINDQFPLIKTNWLSPLFITSVWLGILYKVLHEVQTIKICLAQKNSKVVLSGRFGDLYPRGGGVLPYISHVGMCRPTGRVFAPFWSKNRYRFCPFWFRIGYGFRGNCGSVWLYLSFQF